MANIIWPSELIPRTFTLKLVPSVQSSSTIFGGSEYVSDLAEDYWEVSMEVDGRSGNTAASLEALVNYIQGGLHTVEFGHFARSQPRGTLPNTTLAASAAKGSDSLVVNNPLPAGSFSVKAGDMLLAGNLLLQVEEDALISGASSEIKIVNRLRNSLSLGASVILNSPKIRWRLSNQSSVSNIVGGTSSVTLDFVEDI